MARSKNPLKGSFIAATEKPNAEPHSKSLNSPTHKQKVRHKGRPPVEMPRGNGLRKSAMGRDSLMGNTLPGKKEPSGIQKAAKGPMRFGDQGRSY